MARARDLRTNLVPQGCHVIVALGRLVRQKRFDDAISAFVEVRRRGTRAVLYVVGTGPEDGRLRERARKACGDGGIDPNDIRFTGVVPDGHDAIWAAMADVAVFCGAVGLGMIVSMAVGTSTLIADEAGCDTELLIDGETGVRYPWGNVSALSDTLAGLVADRGRRATLAAAGRRIVLERATICRMVDGMESAIRYASGLSKNRPRLT